MRYRPTVDIWAHPSSVHTMQRGQWVSAGMRWENKMNIGKFCGVTKAGTVVVAWHGNAKNSTDYTEYVKASMNFAKSRA